MQLQSCPHCETKLLKTTRLTKATPQPINKVLALKEKIANIAVTNATENACTSATGSLL